MFLLDAPEPIFTYIEPQELTFLRLFIVKIWFKKSWAGDAGLRKENGKCH